MTVRDEVIAAAERIGLPPLELRSELAQDCAAPHPRGGTKVMIGPPDSTGITVITLPTGLRASPKPLGVDRGGKQVPLLVSQVLVAHRLDRATGAGESVPLHDLTRGRPRVSVPVDTVCLK